jgi:hypothetical protein
MSPSIGWGEVDGGGAGSNRTQLRRGQQPRRSGAHTWSRLKARSGHAQRNVITVRTSA